MDNINRLFKDMGYSNQQPSAGSNNLTSDYAQRMNENPTPVRGPVNTMTMPTAQDLNAIPYGNANANLLNRDAAQNANMQNRATTLARSRQVDALNNRVFFNPAVVGAGAEALGGAGYQQSYGRYQMPQIETEDSRAQARQRQYEQNVVNADIDRQAATRDVALNWYNKSIQDQFNRSFQEFTSNLQLNVGSRQFNNVMQMAQKSPVLANFLMQIYNPAVVPPDALTMLSQQVIMNILADAEQRYPGNPRQQGNYVASEFAAYMTRMGVSQASGVLQSAIQQGGQEINNARGGW